MSNVGLLKYTGTTTVVVNVSTGIIVDSSIAAQNVENSTQLFTAQKGSEEKVEVTPTGRSLVKGEGPQGQDKTSCQLAPTSKMSHSNAVSVC